MPITVAVAGGTGGLGRAIVEAILKRGKEDVIVLSRKKSDLAPKTESGARLVGVDYNDVPSLTSTLKAGNVHTLIAVLDSNAGPAPELALIEAAERSTTTKRYIPSCWGIDYTPEVGKIFQIGAAKVAYLAALEKTNLEYTEVINGMFADYFVPALPSYMNPFTLVLDVHNNATGIPGDGKTPVAFTHTFDVAAFTATLLSMDTWPKKSYVVGERLSFNDFVKALEEAKGVKFDVSYDDLATLENGRVTELPGHKAMYPFFPKEALQGFAASFGKMFANRFFNTPDGAGEFKARTVREMVRESWGRKS